MKSIAYKVHLLKYRQFNRQTFNLYQHRHHLTDNMTYMYQKTQTHTFNRQHKYIFNRNIDIDTTDTIIRREHKLIITLTNV